MFRTVNFYSEKQFYRIGSWRDHFTNCRNTQRIHIRLKCGNKNYIGAWHRITFWRLKNFFTTDFEWGSRPSFHSSTIISGIPVHLTYITLWVRAWACACVCVCMCVYNSSEHLYGDVHITFTRAKHSKLQVGGKKIEEIFLDKFFWSAFLWLGPSSALPQLTSSQSLRWECAGTCHLPELKYPQLFGPGQPTRKIITWSQTYLSPSLFFSFVSIYL